MGDNPIDFLMGLTKEVTGALRELENDLPEAVGRVERQVKIIVTWLVRLEGEKDLPTELQSILTEVKQSIENVRNAVVDYGNKHAQAPSWTKYMGASKQLIMAFAPAAAVSIAMLPYGALIIVAILAAVVVFFLRFPHLLRQLQDAWNADMSLQQFREIETDLKENAKQLRHFVNLKLQIKKERKYDIAKVLQDDRTMQWWCLNFGSQTSSVATDRFIQALVQEQPTYEKARKDAQHAISSVIRDIIDANGDGDISPQEFLSFLQFFGPLDQCVDKVVRSILDFGTSPPIRYPWFFWKKLDRRLVEESCPKQGVGTFLIRCSSLPGEFALSYVRADKKVVHIKIVNTPEGFLFSNNADKKFPDLAQLVIAHRQLLVKEYVDPLQRVVFNVGGRKFESTVGVFTPHPDTLLAKMVGTGIRAEEEEIFLDRDPEAFAVILNWYRNGALLPSPVVSRALLGAELRYFGIPEEAVGDEATSFSSPATQGGVHPAALAARLSHLASGDSSAPSGARSLTSSGYTAREETDSNKLLQAAHHNPTPNPNPASAAVAAAPAPAPAPTAAPEPVAVPDPAPPRAALTSASANNALESGPVEPAKPHVEEAKKEEPPAPAPAAAPAPAPAAADSTHVATPAAADPAHHALHVLPKQQSEAIINPGAPPVARLTLEQTYFHGMVSDADTLALLQGKPPGTYLARNSKSNPGTCITISYVDPKGKMVNFRLWKTGPARYSLNQTSATAQAWESVQAFVEAFPEQLKSPIERAAQTAYEAD